MQFLLSFESLSLWLAVTAIILLVTLELVSPSYGKTSLFIERERLRNVALTVSLLFVIAIALRIYELIV